MAYIANKKPDGLTQAQPLTGSENIVVSQITAGVPVVLKAALTALRTYIFGLTGAPSYDPSSNDASTVIVRTSPGGELKSVTLSSIVPEENITNAKVAPGADIAFTKLEPLPATNILVGNASNDAAAVALSGDATLSNAGVMSIAANAVTAAKLATDAVETLKIKNGQVTAAKLATDAVETLKIKDANVTAAKLATDAVETLKIKDANVTAAKLAVDAVTTAKILDANVTGPKLAVDAVTVTKIMDGQVTNPKLATDSVTVGKIAAGQVTGIKMAAGMPIQIVQARTAAQVSVNGPWGSANTLPTSNVGNVVLTQGLTLSKSSNQVRVQVNIIAANVDQSVAWMFAAVFRRDSGGNWATQVNAIATGGVYAQQGIFVRDDIPFDFIDTPGHLTPEYRVQLYYLNDGRHNGWVMNLPILGNLRYSSLTLTEIAS